MKKTLCAALFAATLALFGQQKEFSFKPALENGRASFRPGDKVTFKMDVKYPDGYRFAAWNVHAYAKNVPASFAETLKLKVSGSDPQWQSIRFHQWRWLAPDNKNMQGWFGTVHWPEGDYCISATALFRRKDKPDVKTDKYVSSELVFSIEK